MKAIILLFCIVASMRCTSSEDRANRNKTEKLIAAVDKAPDNFTIRRQLFEHLFETGDCMKLVTLYEADSDVLRDSVRFRILYASSLARNAGSVKKIEDKLLLVKRGMIQFDKCVRDFPDSKEVYLWRARTYSNFPSIFNVLQTILDDVDTCQVREKRGEWILEKKDVRTAADALVNAAKKYKKPEPIDRAIELVGDRLPDADKIATKFQRQKAEIISRKNN